MESEKERKEKQGEAITRTLVEGSGLKEKLESKAAITVWSSSWFPDEGEEKSAIGFPGGREVKSQRRQYVHQSTKQERDWIKVGIFL